MNEIGRKRHECSTERVLEVDGELFYIHENGGERGAWDCKDSDGVWRDSPLEPARAIDHREAVCFLLSWGYENIEVLLDV